MKTFAFGCFISVLAACSTTTNPPPPPPPECGNGVVEGTEACDDGAANGTTGDSCTAACTVVTIQQGHVSATWHLNSVDATTGALSAAACPSGFDTAALHTVAANTDGTAVSACTTAGADCFIDLFNCADGAGLSADLPPRNYLTWVEITNTNGSSLYATSTAEFVDITNVDMNFDTHILVDGGYFKLTWTLHGEQSSSDLTCAQTAAATSAGGSIEVVSTLSTNTSVILTDKFNCEDHFGYSAPLHTGSYDLAIDALNSADAAISNPTSFSGVAVGATANEIVDLGHIVIPIPGL
jgi:cysteine-rich repeat protein